MTSGVTVGGRTGNVREGCSDDLSRAPAPISSCDAAGIGSPAATSRRGDLRSRPLERLAAGSGAVDSAAVDSLTGWVWATRSRSDSVALLDGRTLRMRADSRFGDFASFWSNVDGACVDGGAA